MGIKLVLADDAPFIREAIRHSLKKTEIEIVGEASDGVEAVEITRKAKPNVVLMDIVMPKKSGIEASVEILKENPHVKIIACSTVDQETMVMRAIEAGCCGYVVKPFKVEELLKAIRSAAKS